MKLITLLLIISLPAFSQPYLSMGANNKGASLGAGLLVESIEINTSYDFPLARVDKPTVLSFSIGKQFILSSNDYSHWTVMGGVGYAHRTYKDFSTYDTDSKITKVSEFKPMYIAEVGYNAHVGRISLVVKRCEIMYVGASMRLFFK